MARAVSARPTVGSLFAGVEGFGQGLEQAGFEVAWQVEIDKDAVSVLERHYPTVRRYRDVREVNGADLPRVDVLVGGFPCQDLSVAGRRQGLAGERSGLFFEVARIAAESATPWLLLENVDGLLSQWTPVEAPPSGVEIGTEWEVEESADLGVVLATLQEHGYLGCLRVLDAQHFGVAQRRERVFIVAHLGATGERALEVLLEPESVFRDLASCFQTGQGTADVPADGTGDSGVADALLASYGNGSPRGDGADNQIVGAVADTLRSHPRPGSNSLGAIVGSEGVAHALTAHGGSHGRIDAESETFIVSAPLTAGGHPNSNMPGRHREDDYDLVALAFSVRHAERQPSDITACLQAGVGETGNMLPGVVYGVDWQKDGASICDGSPTLMTERTPAVSGSAFGGVRRLMPVECERLMGWTDGHTERRADGSLIPDGPRYRMIGNGVVAPVARWIGERLIRAIRGEA